MYENAFNYLFAFKNLSDTLKDLAFNQNILHKENQFVLEKKDKALNYAMISKNRQSIIDVTGLNDDKDFSIRNLLFQDSAFIIFSTEPK